jgi:hypothetical protein
MKHALTLIAIFLLSACTSPERQSAAQDLAETITAAMKDGVVTQDEADLIGVKMQAFRDAPTAAPWVEMVTTALGTLAAGFFGIRYLPNRYLVGPQEAQALDKAAGIKKPA